MNELIARLPAAIDVVLLERVGLAVLIFLGMLLCVRLFLSIVIRRLRSVATRRQVQPPLIVMAFLERVSGWIWAFLALALAAQVLPLPQLLERIIDAAAVIVLVILGVQLVLHVVEHLLIRHVPRARAGDGESLPAFLRFTLGFTLWVLGILLILSNIGVNVSSLLAGMGIGGIAIALATQNILGDLFSSFSLYFDQPFKEGDFIVVGQHMGTVKKIGLQTTRLQALQGEEIAISNRELASARIQNYKRMRHRRVEVRFTVAAPVDIDALERVPALVQQAIEGQKSVRFSRAHFKDFADNGYAIEYVYHVEHDDFGGYMDVQQAINFAILRLLQEKGITILPTKKVEPVPAAPLPPLRR